MSAMGDSRWIINEGAADAGGALAAFAIHDGHTIRPDLVSSLSINEDQRYREEDPFTGRLAEVVETHVIVNMSRFEVDLNRPRETAVYRKPEDAWGLDVWKGGISDDMVEGSLRFYDSFYKDAYDLLKRLEGVYGKFVVLDLHSYCHRRGGPGEPAEPAANNPDINVGTGTMNRHLWANIVDRFVSDIGSRKVLGRPVDVRENVKFRGGYFPQWVHQTFPETGCCIAIEVKKIFMDEWSGVLNEAAFKDVREALKFALPGLLEELNSN